MLKFVFYISSFFLINLLAVFAHSHLIFNSKVGGEVEDSPYLIKHPYLLEDFYNQVEWVQELEELETSVRQQKVIIEQNIRIKKERIYQLKNLIGSNQAPAEAKLQAKLSYEHFEYGGIPYSFCRGIQWNDGRKDRKRLFCNVTDWKMYNESLNKQKENAKIEDETIINKQFKELSELKFIKIEHLKRKENDEKIKKKLNSEFNEYLKKLKLIINNGTVINDELKLLPKYPILNITNNLTIPSFFHPSWPSIKECNNNKINYFEENYLNNFKFSELFISPENKGFLVSDLFTKYLALENNELTPLPWKLPYCSSYINNELLLNEKLKFIENLNIFKKLKSGYFGSSDKFAEKKLKNELFKLVGYNLNNKQTQQQPLIREIGQRIGNLLKFNIGPRWITFNLAALYFRYLGIPNEAINCLELALKYSKYEDIALTQLIQIILRVNNYLNQNDINDLEKILNISMEISKNEPINYHLMAILYQLKGNSFISEKFLFKSLKLDFNFKPSLNMLLIKKCFKRIINSSKKSLQFNNIYSPLCCWPNEQEIYCFNQLTNKNNKKIKKLNCYKPLFNNYLFNINLNYFRCNTPYKRKSYLPSEFSKLIILLIFPVAKLRELKDNIFAKKIEKEINQKLSKENNIIKEFPVFPLDYGGYSIERINAHQRPILPESIKEQINQFEINFNLINNNILLNNEQNGQINSENNLIKKEESQKLKKSLITQIDGTFLEKLSNRDEVNSKLDDIYLLKILPIPKPFMVKKGKEFSFSLKLSSLKEICKTHKKLNNNLLFEQPISTWLSPSAKGIKINDYINNFNNKILLLSSKLSKNNNLLLFEQPECPELESPQLSSILLKELDKLPAYIYKEYLNKFYKPEKALRDTFRSIGSSSLKLDNIEIVAYKLYFALKESISSSNSTSNISNFVLGTLSSLYWRIKGDSINSIKCLRYSLYNSPNEYIDVPLISLANIYHQAGFFHSALFTLDKAFKTGENIVAVHFTLANVYSTIGNYYNALQFYYSTLSLQSNFEPAKTSIISIHCLTNGKIYINLFIT